MLYRIAIALALVAVLLSVIVLKDDVESPSVAPATSSNHDEARFKGLTIN